MKGTPHKTTPKVRDGQVQKKNRHARTQNYWNAPQRIPVFDREKPGPGHKHYLRKDYLLRFIKILPDWEELSKDLNAVMLAEGGCELGWWSEGVIGICAWPRDGTVTLSRDAFVAHKDIFDRLHVQSINQNNHYICHFSESQVRAFQLLNVLLHELGHHHDRDYDSGEKYAEEYARKYEARIWQDYINEFGLPDS